AIGAKYESVGGPGYYGLPTSDEVDAPELPGGRVSHFQFGRDIYWSPSTGVLMADLGRFRTWLVQTGTPLHETGSTFAFRMVDWNGDGRQDLVAISKSGTGSRTTEVHILSGADNFQTWLLHAATALQETGDTFDFHLVDWNGDGRQDLVAISKSGTG